MNGLFITFEGVEGAGKTTQIALLKDALRGLGRTVFATREPGGDPTAEAIRGVLLSTGAGTSGGASPPTPTAELLLFLAARAQVVERVIRPHLAAGEVVLCDRYVDSTVAYQGYARAHDIEWVRRLNAFATGGLLPALTVLFDLDPRAGLGRQTDRNRMESEPLDFHERVRAGFLAEAEQDPRRFRVIDAARPVQAIHADVLAAVRPFLAG